MKKNSKSLVYIIGITLLAFLALIPIMVKNDYFLHIIVMCCISIIYAQSLNLITGYMGAYSLAHAAFAGLGAYTTGLLTVDAGLPVGLTFLAAIVVSGLFGVILAIPSLKLKSSYLVITTISFGKIISLLIINSVDLTRGPRGLPGIPPIKIDLGFLKLDFSTKQMYFYLVYLAVIVVAIIYSRLIKSRTGRALTAVREDSIASEVIGVNVVYYKVLAFVIGTMTAGFAGALYTHYIRFISPETFDVANSISMMIMVTLGGMGTFWGPILGAITITMMLEMLRFLLDYKMIIYAVILFVVIFFLPKGLVGLLEKIGNLAKKLFSKKTVDSSPNNQGWR